MSNLFLWDVLLEKCAWGPKINATWILLYIVMTSVLSGNARFNILFLFSTPLLATFWPFFRTTIRALSFHLAGFISSITTSDLWEIAENRHLPETLYLQDHACKSCPNKSFMTNAQYMAVTGDADFEGWCRIKAYIPSVNAIL